jgi:hypothetical protein
MNSKDVCIIIIVDENFGTKVTTKICCSFLLGDTHSEGQNSKLNPLNKPQNLVRLCPNLFIFKLKN